MPPVNRERSLPDASKSDNRDEVGFGICPSFVELLQLRLAPDQQGINCRELRDGDLMWTRKRRGCGTRKGGRSATWGQAFDTVYQSLTSLSFIRADQVDVNDMAQQRRDVAGTQQDGQQALGTLAERRLPLNLR